MSETKAGQSAANALARMKPRCGAEMLINGGNSTLPDVNVNAPHRFLAKAKTMNKRSSPPISAEIASQIRYLVMEKGLYQHQAAAIVGVNQGRVSEVMRGQHFPNVPPAQGSLPF